MIAIAEHLRAQEAEVRQQDSFLRMLPGIRRFARRAFQYLGEEAQEDAVAEAVANAFVAFVRLVERGKEELAFASVLAKYAVSQVQEGRRVGGRLNSKDALSRTAARRRGFTVEPLPHLCDEDGNWVEAVMDDRQTPIPDQAAFRCDFPKWLESHPLRERRMIESLAQNHSTSEVANRFGVSAARVSQLRTEFAHSWAAFHAEGSDPS
jgi:RNA polymerase sigma factor (sigma-70 family)